MILLNMITYARVVNKIPFSRRFTSKYVTQVLCSEEMEAIYKSEVVMEDMTVHCLSLL